MSIAPKSAEAPATALRPMSAPTVANSPLKMGVTNQMFATWLAQSGLSVISKPPSACFGCDGNVFKCIWKDAVSLGGKRYSLGMDMSVGVQRVGAAWLMGNGIRKVELTWDHLPYGFRLQARTAMQSLLAKNAATAQRRKSRRGPSLDAVRSVLNRLADAF